SVLRKWIALARWPVSAAGVAFLMAALTAQAQPFPPAFTNDAMVFDLNGAFDNFATNGSYHIGENFSGDTLYIENGAQLSTAGGLIGSRFQSTNLTIGNAVLVSTGGTWTSTNELDVGAGFALYSALVVTNGGLVFCSGGAVGSIGGY